MQQRVLILTIWDYIAIKVRKECSNYQYGTQIKKLLIIHKTLVIAFLFNFSYFEGAWWNHTAYVLLTVKPIMNSPLFNS